MIAELDKLRSSVTTTLDGRLISEARPTPTEIRDPLIADAIPGALALARYFASADDASLQALIGEAYDASVRSSGLAPAESKTWRLNFLTSFALALRTLLPAMVHLAKTMDREVSSGRPPAPRAESQCLIIEVATIWAQFADAGWSAFPAFAARFFELVGLTRPARKDCRSALAEAGVLDGLSDEQLVRLRHQRALARRKLVKRCEGPSPMMLMVTSWAEQAWENAKSMGWPVEGKAAIWHELAQAQRPAPRTKQRRSTPARGRGRGDASGSASKAARTSRART